MSDIFACILTEFELDGKIMKKYLKKKLLRIYYEDKWKFKSAIINFFKNEVKDEVEKLVLKQSRGTAFQIISG